MANNATAIIRGRVSTAAPHSRFYVDGWAVFKHRPPHGESEDVSCSNIDP
jgi:hypothetical protein